jgi:hypothetical protein
LWAVVVVIKTKQCVIVLSKLTFDQLILDAAESAKEENFIAGLEYYIDSTEQEPNTQ